MEKNIIILFVVTSQIHMIHAISLSDTWNEVKNKAYSAKETIADRWEKLNESTKNAIIGASIAIAATTVAAGSGYAGYSAYQNQPLSKNIVNDPTQNKETLDELISLLSTNPNYANRPEQQKGFLDRFDISDDQKRHLFDIVQYEEKQKNR